MNNIWFNSAKELLRNAKSDFSNHSYNTAYYLSTYCSENALKSILYTKKAALDRKYYIHDQKDLLRAIIEYNLLGDEMIESLKIVIDTSGKKSMGWINLNSDVEAHIDCESEKIPELRNPNGNSTSEEIVLKADAENRVEQAQNIIDILEPFFI